MELDDKLYSLGCRLRSMSGGYLPVDKDRMLCLSDEAHGLEMELYWRYRAKPYYEEELRKLHELIRYITQGD